MMRCLSVNLLWFKLTLLSSLFNFTFANQLDELKNFNGIRSNIKDINIGVLSALRQPTTGLKCNNSEYAINPRFLQSLYFLESGINEANKNKEDFFNISIGYVFMDTCNTIGESIDKSLMMIPRFDDSCPIKSNQSNYYQVQAVVAPTSSSESVIYSPLLSRYKIPHIGPLATSDILSDKERFGYFSRTVSPDKFQADALIDFISHFKWNYVSLLYVEGPYGENLAKVFRKNSAKRGICLAVDEMISLDNPVDDFLKAFSSIESSPSSEIIVTFLEQRETKLFYEHLQISTINDNKIILASDALSLFRIQSIYKLRANKTFGITLQYTRFYNSVSVLNDINPANNPNSIYIKQYWSVIFNCTWETDNKKLKICDPKANMTDAKIQISGDSLEYDCLQIFIQAMKNVVKKYCPQTSPLDAHFCITGERLLQEIRTGTFNTTIGKVQFDKNGDVYGGYNIVQYTEDGKWINIGKWSRDKKGVDLVDNIAWPYSFIPRSVCSQPCPPRHYFIQKAVACCWDCRKCRNNEILIDNRTHCKECPQFYWPDDEALVCLSIKPDYLKWSDFETVIIATFGIFGLISASIISIILILKRKEKLIRASSLPLTSIILFAIKLSLLTTFFFLIKPTNTICGVNRYLFSLSNTLIYAPIIMKTNRVYRIFASARKGNQTTKLISNQFQIIMSAVIVLIQIILMVLSTIISGNEASLKQKVRTEDYVELHCNLPLKGFLPCLAYNILLAAISSYYGFLTRKLPENFNEASYIFVSVSTTFFVWLVLLPVYFTTEIAKYQSVLLAATCLLNSLITLVCLFAPKLYALWFIDEKTLHFVPATINTVQSVSSFVK